MLLYSFTFSATGPFESFGILWNPLESFGTLLLLHPASLGPQRLGLLKIYLKMYQASAQQWAGGFESVQRNKPNKQAEEVRIWYLKFLRWMIRDLLAYHIRIYPWWNSRFFLLFRDVYCKRMQKKIKDDKRRFTKSSDNRNITYLNECIM